MRRASFTPLFTTSNQEPLIVVEESKTGEEENDNTECKSQHSEDSDLESPTNPYLLSPFTETLHRKHSLPSIQITEGITASQTRRLSEIGTDGNVLSNKEIEFLATLSRNASSSSSGRRHSIVTISAVPTTIFGRNRRESIGGVSFSRRGSAIQGPPLTDRRGSIHNLQLDIMDGIVNTKKARPGNGADCFPGNETKVGLQA